MVTHSSILAWRIPWTEETDGLQSIGSQRVRHDWVTNPFLSHETRRRCFKFLSFLLIYPTQSSESKMNLFRIPVLVCRISRFSHVRLFVTPWTAAHQSPLSMGFSRQEYWSGLPFPSPGDLPDPGIEPVSPALEADALTSEPPGKPRMAYNQQIKFVWMAWEVRVQGVGKQHQVLKSKLFQWHTQAFKPGTSFWMVLGREELGWRENFQQGARSVWLVEVMLL